MINHSNNIYRPILLPKLRSDALTGSAKGQPCHARIASFYPNYSCSGPDTSVLCHTSGIGKSHASKTTDITAVIGCGRCHAILDGPDKMRRDYILERYPTALENRIRMAVTETLSYWLMEGLIIVPDGKLTK